MAASVIFPRNLALTATFPGTVTATITPATAGAITTDQGYTLTVPTFPATCLRVFVRNVGSALEGGADVAFVFNGDNIAVGESRLLEAKFDPVTNVFKYVTGPTVTNASGAGIWFEIDS